MPIEKPVEKRFIFNGSAVAFAGRIRRPEDVFVKAAAGSHLPVTGGQAEIKLQGQELAPYHYKAFIKFTTAHTRAQGDFSDPRKAADYTHSNHGENELPANTVVQSRLEGLQIDAEADPEKQTPRRLLEVKALEVHMESTSTRHGEPISFRSLSVDFDGIKLTSGTSAPVELKVHTAPEVFSECDTKQKLVDRYAKDGEFRKKFAACFHPPGTSLPGMIGDIFSRHELPHADRGPIVATFVTQLEWVGGVAPEGTEILNNRLTVHGLGRIYFGEIIVEEGSRRVTLLRFELGSLIGGDASACEVVSNGSRWPPAK